MDLITIIMSLCGLLLGGSGIGAFMYHRETKQSKNLDNERKKLDNEKEKSEGWRSQYVEAERKSQAKSAKIENLYDIIGKKTTEITKLKSRLARYGILRCDEVACPARKPPINIMDVSLDDNQKKE